MNLPRKCGNIYIKFDENNNPEYGFEVEDGYHDRKLIRKFIIMTDKPIDTIILPKFFEKGLDASHITNEDWNKRFYLLFERYATGEVKLCEDCFKGIKDAKIIVPFTGSIMIDYGSFDGDANIQFITNNNLRLKQVYRRFDSGFDYEHENWTLVADKSFNYQGTMCGDDYYVEDYNEKNLKHKVANIKLKNKTFSNENEKTF